MFAGILEDTVFKTTNNGESKHYNVFRKTLTDITGNSINLPSKLGDSIEFSFMSNISSLWIKNRLKSLVILQRNNKQVIQSALSNKLTLSTEIKSINKQYFKIYPNPSNSFINIDIDEEVQILVTDILGNQVLDEKVTKGLPIDISSLKLGIYFIQIIGKEQYYTRFTKF